MLFSHQNREIDIYLVGKSLWTPEYCWNVQQQDTSEHSFDWLVWFSPEGFDCEMFQTDVFGAFSSALNRLWPLSQHVGNVQIKHNTEH